MIYLDYNATTPVAPEVFRAMRPYLEGEFGNPSCDYPLGLKAREAVHRARGGGGPAGVRACRRGFYQRRH